MGTAILILLLAFAIYSIVKLVKKILSAGKEILDEASDNSDTSNDDSKPWLNDENGKGGRMGKGGGNMLTLLMSVLALKEGFDILTGGNKGGGLL